MLNFKDRCKLRLVAVLLPLLVAVPPLTTAAAQTPGRTPAVQPLAGITQNRINEFAAACLDCESAFSGMKGGLKPGEKQAQFAARMESYLAAMAALCRETSPLRVVPQLADRSEENTGRWRRIARAAAGLPSAERQARAAWQMERQGKTDPQLGPKFMTCLTQVQALLNLLRDARP